MSIYNTLNKEQSEAVFCTEGPLLILAGAGSGKTRVLTHRAVYLIEEMGVNPWNILAITFTNKAAGEMRERIDQLVGMGAESIWVSTFHSMCVRILRRYINFIGYDTNFTIYDTDDQKTLMKDVCKYLQIDTKMFKERMLMSAISSAKNEMITAEEFALQAEGDFRQKKIAQVYIEYEKQMKANNALDFDDLLLKTVQLFQTQKEVLEQYQERFRYIMVDEYQDTNTVQFQLIWLLSGKYRNLCVVGDDDQSIYKFRGANIKNILNFEEQFPDAKVIKLEQNYRSTSTILDAANAVIKNNKGRKEKALWTDNGQGDRIDFRQFESAFDEAEFVVSDIRKDVADAKRNYCDHAILYRTNAQSRMFEEKLVLMGVPYKIIGGVNFYARREIKDILAYLKTIENGKDDLAVRRIINVPKRGIGLATISKVQDFAVLHEISFYDALLAASMVPGAGRSVSKLESFAALIEHFKTEKEHLSLTDLLDLIIQETAYLDMIHEEEEEEAENRIENIEELKNKLKAYEEAAREMGNTPTLGEFLEEVALVADIDSLEEDSDYVVLMTLHSAKGLEFPHVYLVGMEEGLFPSYMSIHAEDSREEIEEERRLCYVGITRAKEKLTLCCARKRMVHGDFQYNQMSRFLKEVPDELLENGNMFKKEKVAKSFAFGEEVPIKKEYQRKNTVPYYFEKKPVQQFQVSSGKGPGYDVGDRVRHTKYGEGIVTSIVEGGRDYEVTVEFDQFGTKKMFAMFAKLAKI